MKKIVESKKNTRQVKEAKNASFIKYRKEKTTRVEVVFTGKMKEHIDAITNRATYIKKLVEKDMNKAGVSSNS